MSDKKRVVFNLSEEIYQKMLKDKKKCGMTSLGEVMRDALVLRWALQDKIVDGYTQVKLVDPKTKLEILMVIPGLTRGSDER